MVIRIKAKRLILSLLIIVKMLSYAQGHPVTNDGMTEVVLDNKKPFAEQVEGRVNARFVVRYNFDMNDMKCDEPVALLSGCTIDFDGGSIRNGHLKLNETTIIGKPKFLCRVSGTVTNSDIHVEWGKGDYWLNDFFALSKDKNAIFDGKTYQLKYPCNIPSCHVKGNSSKIIINQIDYPERWEVGLPFICSGTADNRKNLLIEDLQIVNNAPSKHTIYLFGFDGCDSVVIKRCKFITYRYDDFYRVQPLDSRGLVNSTLIEDCYVENQNYRVDAGGGIWFRCILGSFGDITIKNTTIINNNSDEEICFNRPSKIAHPFIGKILLEGNTIIANQEEGSNHYVALDFQHVYDKDGASIHIANNLIKSVHCAPYHFMQTRCSILANNNRIIYGGKRSISGAGRFYEVFPDIDKEKFRCVFTNNEVNVDLKGDSSQDYILFSVRTTATKNKVNANSTLPIILTTGDTSVFTENNVTISSPNVYLTRGQFADISNNLIIVKKLTSDAIVIDGSWSSKTPEYIRIFKNNTLEYRWKSKKSPKAVWEQSGGNNRLEISNNNVRGFHLTFFGHGDKVLVKENNIFKGCYIRKGRADKYEVMNDIYRGPTNKRPEKLDKYKGYAFFDTTIGKVIYWNGSTWEDAEERIM